MLRTRTDSRSGSGRFRRLGRQNRPAGRILVWLLAVLLMAVCLVVYVAYAMSGGGDTGGQSVAHVHPVVRGDFEYFVTEPGDVESAGNVEIRCRVKSKGTPGVAILSLHPEGEYAKKGDLLVPFDDSLFRQELTEQEILVAQAESLVIQATSDLRSAEIALEEYIRGAFEQQTTLIESELFVAQENVRRSEEYLKFSRMLAARGYVTKMQLEGDRFAVEKAKSDLRSAEEKLNVHQKYTYKKMVVQLESQVEKLKANLKAAESTLALNVQKRDEIGQQIDNCRVVAPQDGQVVYASETEGRDEEAIIIEPGSVIRQGQVVIRLPNTEQMRVGVRVSESKIGLVQSDKPAFVYLDTDPDRAYRGRVTEVSNFPLPKRRSYNPNEYRAVVEVFDQLPSFRAGLRARVRISVDTQQDVLKVPLDAVFVHAEKHYCIVNEGDAWRAQQVEIGPNNDEFVVIRDGLAQGELVAVDPDAYRALVDLPPAAPAEPDIESAEALAAQQSQTAPDVPAELVSGGQ